MAIRQVNGHAVTDVIGKPQQHGSTTVVGRKLPTQMEPQKRKSVAKTVYDKMPY